MTRLCWNGFLGNVFRGFSPPPELAEPIQAGRAHFVPVVLGYPKVLPVPHDVAEDGGAQEDHVSSSRGIFYPQLQTIQPTFVPVQNAF